jgi:hypothetical protein
MDLLHVRDRPATQDIALTVRNHTNSELKLG